MSKELPIAISISRQLGSGGSVIGKSVAKHLNFLFLDREIIIEASSRLGASLQDIEAKDENTLGFWKSFISSLQYASLDFIPPTIKPSDRDIYETEAELISEVSVKESVVVVGRGGAHILKNHPNHLSVFLHSNIEFRQKRVQEIFNISQKEARELILETDYARERHIHKFTGQNIYDLRNYNLVIDTGVTGLDYSEKIIKKYIQARFFNAN